MTVDLPYRQYGEDEPTSDDQRAPTGAEASVDFAAARRSWRARLLIGGSLVVAVGLLGLLVLSLAQKQGSFAGFAINAVGQLGRVNPGPAPDFTVPLYAGGTFRLSAERGHVVVVNYWASWCPPCRDEAPVLERAWQQYRGQGTVFVGLDLWDTAADAHTFMQQFGIDYPNGPDQAGTAAIDYGVTGIPETFIILPDGTIARHWIGPLIDAQIDALIAETQP